MLGPGPAEQRKSAAPRPGHDLFRCKPESTLEPFCIGRPHLGIDNARLYDIQPKRAMLEFKGDRFALMKAEYEKAGPEPSHTRYGYVVPNGAVDHAVFA